MPDAHGPRGPLRWHGPRVGDVIAGVSVALVLIPQSLAYAKLAGLPPSVGLYAAALPPLVAAAFVSSPYLQTGPTALTGILTLGVLSSIPFESQGALLMGAVALAAIVGLVRLLIGVLRLGGIAYLMSEPVMRGFTVAAAVLILLSQLPTVTGVDGTSGNIVVAALQTLVRPQAWNLTALLVAALGLLLMVAGRRVSALFPGVPLAMVMGYVAASAFGWGGAPIGPLPHTLVWPSLVGMPWELLPRLVVGGSVIAIVGFAEPSAIARTLASDREARWDPNREFVSQGVANLAAALSSAFPVGGSFSRSALSQLAGAKTRWAGAVTGLVVLLVLPFANVLAQVPRAVLGAIVIGSVLSLLDVRALMRVWTFSRSQFALAAGTFALTLLLAPRIDYAVLIGVGASIGLLLLRDLGLDAHEVRDLDGSDAIELSGVLWFGTAPSLEAVLDGWIAAHPGASRVTVRCDKVARMDVSGWMGLEALVRRAASKGVRAELIGLKGGRGGWPGDGRGFPGPTDPDSTKG